jgi:protein SCO1/2
MASRNLRLALLGMLAAAILAVGLLRQFTPSSQALPRLRALEPFSLLDRHGNIYGSADLRGHTWIASFIYTDCPGPCPLVVRRLKQIDQRLADQPAIRIISISVDPATDTPEVLREYGDAHGIPQGRWKLLTGDPEYVLAVVRKNFLLGVGEAREMFPDGTDDAVIQQAIEEEGRVTHSLRFALVDGDLEVRGYYQSGEAEDIERLIADALSLAP